MSGTSQHSYHVKLFLYKNRYIYEIIRKKSISVKLIDDVKYGRKMRTA